MMQLARMRTLDGCIEQLHKDDPGTHLTRYALRKMVLSGDIPHVRAGKKYLINYDALLAILSGGFPVDEPILQSGSIRPVAM